MCEVRLPLSALPEDVTSFTYPDSFEAMALGASFGLPYSPQPYHGQAFKLAQLPEVVRAYGLPSDEPDAAYDGYHLRPCEKYIELQVWSDAPLRRTGS
jgi:hypothetical protein